MTPPSTALMADNSTADSSPRGELMTAFMRNKACDQCRIRKVRCDKTSPCANCKKHNVRCTVSPRAPRARRARPAGSSQNDGKIDSLEQGPERAGSRAASSASPLDESGPRPGHPSTQANSSTGLVTPSLPATPSVVVQQPITQSTTPSASAEQQQGANSLPATEGPSSFSAQSDFAVEFLKKVVGSDRDQGHVFDSQELQDALGHIVDALHKQQSSPDMAFSATNASPPPPRQRPKMPPIEASVAVIRSTEDRARIVMYHLSSVIEVASMSEMCLKVYFSQDYSDAEFIILNAALYFLFGQHDEHEENRSICAENLVNALARLPLYIKPSFDMTLALILGAIFAIESFKPLVACTLITAGFQAAYSLGFHTRQKGADKGIDSPNKSGLLFWAIYFLERSLSLGLGRSSTIPNSDITVPLPGGPKFPQASGMTAYRNMVMTARLSGKVYEDLYSAQALHLPADARQQKVAALSQELQDIREAHRVCREAIPVNQPEPERAEKMRQLVEFIYYSDEIHCLSILTLIQRAAPPPTTGPSTTFTDECIASARRVIEVHHKFVPLLKERGTPFVSAHVNWILNFLPFISFVVLFCHVIETGSTQDQNLMGDFVQSMEVASTISNFKDNHHRLFHVLHTVAGRYSELKASLTPSQVDNVELRTEMDAYLSSLGYHPMQQDVSQGFVAQPTMSFLDIPMDTSAADGSAGSNPQLGNWFSWSQQMMGLLDSNQLDI